MGVQDLIITPIWFLLLLIGAYVVRPMVTNSLTRKYFIPSVLVKFIGAIALGLIYQFYYGGGDTFTFHTHGSKWIWRACMDDPMAGLQLFLTPAGNYDGSLYSYSSKIWMFRDPTSFFVIKVAAFFDLFTLNTYSATALFFATFAFSGHWALYSIFQLRYPEQSKNLALTCLFIPSAIFWGSGILKDSITLGALCWMTYALIRMTIFQRFSLSNIILLVFMGWVIYSIKIYILLCFLVATSIFLYFLYISVIQNQLIKVLVAPILILIFLGGGYFTMDQIAQDDSRYALDKIAQTAMITAYDIRYGWGARQGDNSGYTLGNLDGTVGSMIRLAPQAMVVTLFRPWLWEVKNVLMLLASIESLAVLILTITILINTKLSTLWRIFMQPEFVFCISFSLLFAFAVGVSTFNFGTLMRYKIPVLPFFGIALTILLSQTQKKYV